MTRTLGDARYIESVSGTLDCQDLDRTKGRVDVGVVIRVCAKSACGSFQYISKVKCCIAVVPDFSSQQLMTKSIISSRFKASLCFITQRAVSPQ